MFTKLKYQIRNYFGFSAKETNGFLILLVLMAVALTAPFILKKIWYSDDGINYTILEYDKATSSNIAQTTTTPSHSSLFTFDPNNCSQEDLTNLGVEDFIAKRIIKYREKGGRFKVKKDLLKIYDFPKELYSKLHPYILLPDSISSGNYSHPQIAIHPFDINTSDTTQLIELKGIGSVLAARIINFRNLLGGFVNSSQIKEVYGIDPEVVNGIQKYLIVKPGFQPKKLNLNTATAQELDEHPYISRKEAGVVVNYRMEHGNYTTVADLEKVKVFTPEQIKRLTPYLEVN